MTDAMAEQASRPLDGQSLSASLLSAVAAYWLVTSCLMAAVLLPQAPDLIGPDNDDVMRLVEVRDWLSGQGWFDLMQYRLGLDGGTMMHWSRLVDAPIGFLIGIFAFFMPMAAAEGVAASVWPLLLIGPLLLPLAIVGRRMGGTRTMHIALGLGSIFAFTCHKFRPGALDHHNLQLALAIWVAALLADRHASIRGHGAAGVAAALAIAIGAETVPLVAVACLCVGVRWIWQGKAFAPAARAFGLALALAVTVTFIGTISPRHYAVVVCDSLSLGFYSLTAFGGAGLFVLTLLPDAAGRAGRLAGAIALGGLLAVSAVGIAPQCLASPLADLDPMLVEMWLNAVTEARSVFSQLKLSPESVAGFYAVGLIAMGICLFRIWRAEQRAIHLLFLVLIAATWGISLVQVRGSFFVSLLSIPPFAALIADLQMKVRRNPRDVTASVVFVTITLAAVPAFWALAGLVLKQGINGVSMNMLSTSAAGEIGECGNAADMATLNGLEKGLVAAPSNSGAEILRYTQHRVLSAPYHRNQGGMLTELHVGLAQPGEALAFIRGSGTTIIAFCESDPQTKSIIRMKPDGLYAALAKGDAPDYLLPVANTGGGFKIYETRR